jgi:hypothetical protein
MPQCLFLFFQLLDKMEHNVPAVGDVFAARIRTLYSKDHGRKKCGGTTAREWSEAQ